MNLRPLLKGFTEFDEVKLFSGTADQGILKWNSDEETLDLTQNGAVLQIGQESHIHVRNNTGSTIPNGTPVMATGTLGASGRITVAPMNGTVESNYRLLIGITTETIENGTDGKVTSFGKVRGINTSSYAEGSVLYISTSTIGALTTTSPTSGMVVPVAFVINSHATTGTVMVRVTPINEKNLANNLFVPLATRGVANGVATLDAGGLVPSTQLPSTFSGTITNSLQLGGVVAANYYRSDTSRATRYIKSFTIAASNTNWWRVATLTGSNQNRTARFFLGNSGHFHLEILMSCGAGGDYVDFECWVRGNYVYWTSYPYEIRIVPSGTNLPTYVDIRLAGGGGSTFRIDEVMSHAVDGAHVTYNGTDVGSAAAGTVYTLFNASGNVSRYVRHAPGVQSVELKSDGWYVGGSKTWTAGNDGSGSGLDADLLDGLHLHTGRNNEANKVVRTDGSGYIQAGWINTPSGNNGTAGITRIYASSDDYIRYYTPANFKSTLSLVDRTGFNAIQDLNYLADMNSLGTTQPSGIYSYDNPANGPFGQWTTWLSVFGHTSGDRYGFQLAKGYWDHRLRFRTVTSNSIGEWYNIQIEGRSKALEISANNNNNITVEREKIYFVYTYTGAVNVYLPAAANTKIGDIITFLNFHHTWVYYNTFTISPQANTYIHNDPSAMTVDLKIGGFSLQCNYADGGSAWWSII